MPKKPANKVVESTPVEVPIKLEPVVEEILSTPTSQKTPRKIHSRDSVEQEFDTLISLVETEIEKLRDSSQQSKGIKFLRSVNKQVKNIKLHTLKICKAKKNGVKRVSNAKGGLSKPVEVSGELAQFIGWSPKELHSRSEVTKAVCDYIKANKLQDPENGRCILVNKDSKLKKLLKYDEVKEQKPLDYALLQRYLKPHYPKPEGKVLAEVQKIDAKVQEKPVNATKKR